MYKHRVHTLAEKSDGSKGFRIAAGQRMRNGKSLKNREWYRREDTMTKLERRTNAPIPQHESDSERENESGIENKDDESEHIKSQPKDDGIE
jgi:hypothetical protein